MGEEFLTETDYCIPQDGGFVGRLEEKGWQENKTQVYLDQGTYRGCASARKNDGGQFVGPPKSHGTASLAENGIGCPLKGKGAHAIKRHHFESGNN